MEKAQTRITSQGQVSVPAAVRRLLHLTPGSVLVWSTDGSRVTVERARRHSTGELHAVLFGKAAVPSSGSDKAPAKTLAELKQGIREHVKRRHAGR
jgi:antitoxin PrlF